MEIPRHAIMSNSTAPGVDQLQQNVGAVEMMDEANLLE